MTRILNKIKQLPDDIKAINTNFDRLSLDITDRSGTFSSVASVSGLVVSAGTTQSIEVSVVDNLELYTFQKLPVIPRVNIFVTNDVDINYLYPVGSSITGAMAYELEVNVYQSKQVFNQITNEKATYFIIIRNTGASPYTLYVYTDCYYVPAPDEGVAKRPTNV